MIMTLRQKSQGYNEQTLCHFVDGKQTSHTNSKRFKFIHFVIRTKFWPKTWVKVTGLGKKHMKQFAADTNHSNMACRATSSQHAKIHWTVKSCLITLWTKELPRRTYRGRVLWLCSRWYWRLCRFLVFRGT